MTLLIPSSSFVISIFLIAVALANSSTMYLSLYNTFSLFIPIGIIVLFVFFIAFKYSMPKILFDPAITFAYFFISFKYIIKAFSLAFGNEFPFFRSCESMVTYSFGSVYKTFAILFKVEISLASIPNDTVSTAPKEFNIFIAPSANFSALEMLYI